MNQIVVPFDFSKTATAALEYAIHISSRIEGRLILLHCYTPPFGTIAGEENPANAAQDLRKEMLALANEMKKLVTTLCAGIGTADISAMVRYGVEDAADVPEKIVEVATRERAGLIIMGTHGASSIKRRLFGTNTANCLARSPIPVLAVPLAWHYQAVTTVAMATDLSDFGFELDEVVSLAKPLNATISVVYLDYGLDPLKERENTAIAVIRQHAYRNIVYTRVNATLEKPLIGQLRKFLDDVRPQWLAMFTHKPDFWDKVFLLGQTEEMIHAGHLPILSFRKRVFEPAAVADHHY